MERLKMRAISLIVFTASIVAITADSTHYDVNDAPNLFEKFIKDYNRQYKDETDRAIHYAAFVQNLKEINKMNAAAPDTTFGINNLSDYTDAETKNLFGVSHMSGVTE